MKINGISYWVNQDGEFEMLNLDDGLKELCIPAFMQRVSGEIIALSGSIERFFVEEGNVNYYVKGNCLISRKGELIAGAFDSVIPTDGSIKRIGNMAFYGKAPIHLTIPNGVQSMGYRAFAESPSLRSVYIPASVKEMSAPFARCGNLRYIFFNGNHEEWQKVFNCQKITDGEVFPTIYGKTRGAGMHRAAIQNRHVCPVCGKTMFPEAWSYDICDICGWEDDTGAEDYPDEDFGGPNYCSLNEYRRQFQERISKDEDYSWENEKGLR